MELPILIKGNTAIGIEYYTEGGGLCAVEDSQRVSIVKICGGLMSALNTVVKINAEKAIDTSVESLHACMQYTSVWTLILFKLVRKIL